MSDGTCDEMQLLIQADVDGELPVADAARVAAHLERCPGCAETQAQLLALSRRLRTDAPRYAASQALRDSIDGAIMTAAPAAMSAARRAKRPSWQFRLPLASSASFGAGFAIAASLALFLLLPGAGGVLPNDVVSAHIRALQPGHLMDVVSTDQHTVKPWFDGRLPFAPPVKDLTSQGFPLIGGRLDYLDGRLAAALIYKHGKHIINLFTWPDAEVVKPLSSSGSRDGYNFLHWNQDGATYWLVSDVNPRDLAEFVRIWKTF
jgi:anti-sigma factor RsiW